MRRKPLDGMFALLFVRLLVPLLPRVSWSQTPWGKNAGNEVPADQRTMSRQVPFCERVVWPQTVGKELLDR